MKYQIFSINLYTWFGKSHSEKDDSFSRWFIMPKKTVKKVIKKTAKNVRKMPRKAVNVKPVNSITPVTLPVQPTQTVETQAPLVQEVVQPVTEAPVQNVPTEPIVQIKEESKMTDDKGVGKDYDPTEFSQPAVQAGDSSGSKIFLYVGISVVVIALIVGGLFLGGVFKQGSSQSLTGATVITAYCTDSDGGYNRFTKGVAEGTYYLDYQDGTFMDECASGEENKLTEYYCKNDLVVYVTEPCPDGMTCTDGICQ